MVFSKVCTSKACIPVAISKEVANHIRNIMALFAAAGMATCMCEDLSSGPSVTRTAWQKWASSRGANLVVVC